MAKQRRGGRDASGPADAPTTSSPFAGLAVLRDALPPMPTAPTAPAAHSPPRAPRSPAFARKLVVQREKKGRDGKTVTRIRGLAPSSLETLATQLKNALGCGATIDGGDVILLGSLVERAAGWLRAQGAERVIEGN